MSYFAQAVCYTAAIGFFLTAAFAPGRRGPWLWFGLAGAAYSFPFFWHAWSLA